MPSREINFIIEWDDIDNDLFEGQADSTLIRGGGHNHKHIQVAKRMGIYEKGKHVDHINNNPFDHRRANLQMLTPSENIRKAYARKNTVPQKPETKISTEIQNWIEAQGGNVLKLYGNALQRSGEPDLLGGIVHPKITYGVFIHFAVELKIPGEDASKLQYYRMSQWAKVGFVTGVAHNLDEFKQIIGWEDGTTLGTSTGDS